MLGLVLGSDDKAICELPAIIELYAIWGMTGSGGCVS
jgi:hypothetical protein